MTKSRLRSKKKRSRSLHNKMLFSLPTPSYYLPEMTYIEVKDQIDKGNTTLILPIGGYEQNGPYIVLDKHQFILSITLKEVSKKIPILIAPVLPIVPGNLPPRQLYQGTVDVRPETFIQLVIDIMTNYQQQGFKKIVIVTDHAGTQPFMINSIQQSIDRFNQLFSYTTKAIYYPKFYDVYDIRDWLKSEMGINEKSEGYHDDIYQTALLALIDPDLIRYEQRKQKNKLSINGIDISSLKKLKQLGRIVLQKRLDHIIPELKYIIEN